LEPIRFAYLHGFASSPASVKGTVLKGAFGARGLVIRTPDLNRPSFARLSPAAMLDALDRMDAMGEGAWGFVGSSLGGWLAARWAELHPDRVARQVLLCPAFDIGTRWPAILGADAFARWRRDGALSWEDGRGTLQRLHYAFYEESKRVVGRPGVACPTLVIHGTRDEQVPVESSRAWASQHGARLVEVDDGHALVESLDLVVEESLAFLTGSAV